MPDQSHTLSDRVKKVRRANFSRLGIVVAAAGSAVGLGNIWKFPYIAGTYGGAAFIFVYLGFIAAIGLPVMISEFIIGRRSRRNAFGAFRKLAPGTQWYFTGLMGVVAAYMILSFYGVVAGWSLEYVFSSIHNSIAENVSHFTSFPSILEKSPQQMSSQFGEFVTHPLRPLMWQVLFMLLTALIVVVGVKDGIERYSKLLMPILVVILFVLVIRSVTLPGAKEGIAFLLKPDFSSLTSEGVLSALGHAFFSLSLGMGTLITYGSYIHKDNDIGKVAIQVTIADTLIALLAGLAIFPAVFAFGLKEDQGPGLIFVTLPNVFQQMPWGNFFSILFFLLLSVAALTSSISILEVVVAYLSEELKIDRKKATVLAAFTITLVGVLCSLSLGIWGDIKIFGRVFFDLFDHISANILLPLGGLFIMAFMGWKYGRGRTWRELSNNGALRSLRRTVHSAVIFTFGLIFILGSLLAVVIIIYNGIDVSLLSFLFAAIFIEIGWEIVYKPRRYEFLDIFMFLIKVVAPLGIATVFLDGMGLL